MKKYVTVGLVLFTLVILYLYLGKTFSPGSYSNAAIYEFQIRESSLISIIERIKQDNPELQVPVNTCLKDGRRSKSDHWYHIYFYYPKENQIIYAWTPPSAKSATSLALYQ